MYDQEMHDGVKDEAKKAMLKRLIGEMHQKMLQMGGVDAEKEVGHPDVLGAMKSSEADLRGDPSMLHSHEKTEQEPMTGSNPEDMDQDDMDYRKGYLTKGNSSKPPKGTAMMMRVTVAKGKMAPKGKSKGY